MGSLFLFSRMHTPNTLKKGDKVAIIAPSRMINSTQLEEAMKIFAQWGLEVVLGKFVFNSDGYFAGTDSERLHDLQIMLDDPEIKTIFCARGGYGMSRIIDQVNFDAFVKQPKWVVGFSDITALHLKINSLGVESIHGIMPVQFEYLFVENSIEQLRILLFDNSIKHQFQSHPSNQLGEVTAEIIGGNLSLLVDSLGTDNEIETTGKILFVEEIDEYKYKVDRMFNQLKRAGKLAKLKGLIIGDFSELKDTAIPLGLELNEIVHSHMAGFKGPLAFAAPIGHEAENLPIPCGRKITLRVNKNYTELLG